MLLPPDNAHRGIAPSGAMPLCNKNAAKKIFAVVGIVNVWNIGNEHELQAGRISFFL